MGFMEVLGRATGAGVAQPIEAAGKALDNLFTSDEERLTRQEAMQRLQNSPYLAALQISLVEAKSGDKWTSRARPMVLYSFCAVFLIQNGLLPVLWWTYQVFVDITVPPPPALISMDMFMTIVSGVLGLGWIVSRGAEKIKGRAE
ncbi:MAG: holin family protein [Alphaproteobacteria bacterium]|nr:holin family protein [Alphaproteobacteria bacterium]